MPTLKIDRTFEFDPVPLLGQGWKVHEHNRSAAHIEEIDFDQAVLTTTPAAKIHTPLDAYALLSLKKAKLENEELFDPHLVPRKWQGLIGGGLIAVHFGGTRLLSPQGVIGYLYLVNHVWENNNKGSWKYGCRQTLHPWDVNHQFVFLQN